MRQSRRVKEAFAGVQWHLTQAQWFLNGGNPSQARAHALDLLRAGGELAAELSRVTDVQHRRKNT